MMKTRIDECWWVAKYGDHGYVVVYRRPWFRWFRKTYVIRCWGCDLEVMER